MAGNHILFQTVLAAEYRRRLEQLVPDVQCYENPGSAPLREIDILIGWSLPPDLLHSLTGLRWIQATGAGVDQFLALSDLPPHVLVTRVGNNSGHVPGMAEYALAAILAHCRHLYRYADAQRRADWQPRPALPLTRATAGIIGLGRIGSSVASILRRNGMTVRGLRRHAHLAGSGDILVYGWKRLNEFLRGLDFVILTVPLTSETSRMLSMPQFRQMEPTAWIINMSRGAILNEADLILALDQCLLAGAVLDAFNTEPLPRDHPFWSHPRIVVTPHVSGEIVVHEAAAEFAENLQRFRRNQPLHFLVSRERGY